VSKQWRIFVDTGGTFTDCLALSPDGQWRRAKVLSSGVVLERQPDGTLLRRETGLQPPLVAAHLVTETPFGEPLPPLVLRLATTRGTNALLTRTGTPPAFFVTQGFADLLTIGTQARSELFALDIQKPQPLEGLVVEVQERLAADGSILRPLDPVSLRAAARDARAKGYTTAAVALLHAYRNPAHEAQVARILREEGFTLLSLSSALAPFQKLLPRAETTVVNAYLTPILDDYLSGVRRGLSAGSRLFVMTSAGGLVQDQHFTPKDSLLSGPAGGIIGAREAGLCAGFHDLIAFDMGGTSTDVSRISGDALDYTFEHQVGDAHLVAPALAIESVAAGGGSICGCDPYGRLFVGPASAGAHPGPACYGEGGPLTVTDLNLLVGHIDPNRFVLPLDKAAARRRLQELCAQLPSPPEPLDLAHTLLDLANEAMADAIRQISVRKGYDPAQHALVAFGGAGGQHACAVAEKLGITTVIVPPDQSLLSAFGLAHAAIERFAEVQPLAPLSGFPLSETLARLEAQALAAVRTEGARDARITRRLARLRLHGHETPLEVEADLDLTTAFIERFSTVYGYAPDPQRTIELESLRVVAGAVEPLPQSPPPSRGSAVGPALIVEDYSVTVVAPSWHAETVASGALVLRRVTTGHSQTAHSLELFTRRFEAVATEMGEQLRRTALSVNVKERLDYSCALLGPEGDLVATAAHIPVHLGALGVCVRTLIAAGALNTELPVIVNHPAFGGSHLPDITVVTPVRQNGTILGYVASRAHHAELGGTRPGSMPPGATMLAEEGVVIPPTPWDRDRITALLTGGPYPTRALSDNLADLEAQLAANRRGAEALRALAEAHGAETLFTLQAALATRCESIAQAALVPISDSEGDSFLDDGSVIRVAVRREDSTRLMLDFTGTSPTHRANFNAPPAVTTACVLFVLRLLIGVDIPLNEGLLRAVRLILPENTLLNPTFHTDPTRCPAVVAGNTEVSQCVVAALLQAFGLAAGSQGTMNNVLFGNARFGYYETVCGGAGATAHAPGASAVHTHMTNTRITDPELLEARYPVRLERFALRSGSGGHGHHHGGEGIVREYTFLEPVEVSLLSQSRTSGGFGTHGGGDGAPGTQRLIRSNGHVEVLSGVAAASCGVGDRLILETPGGGGYGAPER